MRLIDADMLKRQYEEHKRLFCRNRIEFSTLSDKDKARVDELDNCIAEILNAPTIESERKTGKWIDRWAQNGEQVREVRECSECGAFYLRYYDTADGFDCVPPKYCPNCGAKMEEGDHS